MAGTAGRKGSPAHQPVVVLSANNCWNLVHFRAALLAGLQDAGFRLVVMAPRDTRTPELERQGIEFIPIRLARSGTNPLADARLLMHYGRVLRQIGPVAYCGFTIKPNVYGALAARSAGVPVIANVTGLGTAYLRRGALWQVARAIYKLAFRRAHRVFFQNYEDRGIFLNEGLVRPDQARVIPGDGVDLERFKPDSSTGTSGPAFLFVGRLIRDKGIFEFVEAARALRRELPRARFQLLGGIDPGNRTSLRQAELDRLVAEGIVEHLGEHQDVRSFMRSATAVVLPSYREGLSNALLEGAAMGRPLIGSDVAGIRELIEDGVTGALCEARDPRSLAAAMERVARLSEEELQALGQAARAKVERDFGVSVVVQAYLDAIREASGRPIS